MFIRCLQYHGPLEVNADGAEDSFMGAATSFDGCIAVQTLDTACISARCAATSRKPKFADPRLTAVSQYFKSSMAYKFI